MKGLRNYWSVQHISTVPRIRELTDEYVYCIESVLKSENSSVSMKGSISCHYSIKGLRTHQLTYCFSIVSGVRELVDQHIISVQYQWSKDLLTSVQYLYSL